LVEKRQAHTKILLLTPFAALSRKMGKESVLNRQARNEREEKLYNLCVLRG
jgi:hypothetical protein